MSSVLPTPDTRCVKMSLYPDAPLCCRQVSAVQALPTGQTRTTRGREAGKKWGAPAALLEQDHVNAGMLAQQLP